MAYILSQLKNMAPGVSHKILTTGELCCRWFEEYTWQDKKELHYYFKHAYIDDGKFPSSAELNKWDFATYVDKIRDFASAELWLYIPDPVN